LLRRRQEPRDAMRAPGGEHEDAPTDGQADAEEEEEEEVPEGAC